jgi:hypothetical protein
MPMPDPNKVKERAQDLEHEYELIPVSPLRKLERRMEEIESRSSGLDSKEFYKELVEIIRMNQQLVDELAKANDALRIELSRLPSRLEDMIGKLDELISFIKASAGEDYGAPSIDTMKPLLDKMAEIVDTNKKIAESNQAVLDSIGDMEKKMKRPLPLPPPGTIRRPPLFPPKPV